MLEELLLVHPSKDSASSSSLLLSPKLGRQGYPVAAIWVVSAKSTCGYGIPCHDTLLHLQHHYDFNHPPMMGWILQ